MTGPLTLLIKPAAGLCNMRCGYCFYRTAAEERENRVMTFGTVDVLLQKIKEHAPVSLSVVFQGGEPTLAGPAFFRYFVSQAKGTLNMPVSYALQTNGLLLDNAFAAFLKENGFLVGLSLDGNRATNDRYRVTGQGKSTFDAALRAAKTLRVHGAKFNILSVIDDRNAGDLARTWAFFKEQDFRFLQFIPYVDDVSGVALSPENYARFLKECFNLWYTDYTAGRYVSVRHIDNYLGILLGYPPESCAMRGVCGNYFVIEADGSLYPCDFYCKPAYRLGSVFDDAPFAPSEKQKAFIRQSEVIRNRCKHCKYGFLCRGGCRRDRNSEGTENRYCQAYQAFFNDAIDRMESIAQTLRNNGNSTNKGAFP